MSSAGDVPFSYAQVRPYAVTESLGDLKGPGCRLVLGGATVIFAGLAGPPALMAASVVVGERLDRRAAVVLAIALAAVAAIAAAVLIGQQVAPGHHPTLH
jgi:hypothetical protein